MVHHAIADLCHEQLLKMGKDAVMKRDLDMLPEDIQNKDMMISLGTLYIT